MKLRNKITGEIIDLEQWRLEYYKDSGCITITNEKNQNEQYCYGVFADMKDDWADYIPPEPLIKDEKIRKAVRAWAEALDASEVSYNSCAEYSEGRFEAEMGVADIDFGRVIGLKDGNYSIAELCGEGEE